jgi:hypothetical protein
VLSRVTVRIWSCKHACTLGTDNVFSASSTISQMWMATSNSVQFNLVKVDVGRPTPHYWHGFGREYRSHWSSVYILDRGWCVVVQICEGDMIWTVMKPPASLEHVRVYWTIHARWMVDEALRPVWCLCLQLELSWNVILFAQAATIACTTWAGAKSLHYQLSKVQDIWKSKLVIRTSRLSSTP